jgi:hypothetical protein
MAAEFLKQETIRKEEEVKSLNINDSAFFKLQSLGGFASLNITDRILTQDTPLVVAEFAYLLVLKFYFTIGYSCAQVDSLVAIWAYVCQLYVSKKDLLLNELKSYFLRRLRIPKPSAEKLFIIQAGHGIPEINSDPEFIELKGSILNDFINIFLLRTESYITAETYSGKLISHHLFETIKNVQHPLNINHLYSNVIQIVYNFLTGQLTPTLKRVLLSIFNDLHDFMFSASPEAQSNFYQYFQGIFKYSTSSQTASTTYKKIKNLTLNDLIKFVMIFPGILGETKRFAIHALKTNEAQLSVKEVALEGNNYGVIKTYVLNNGNQAIEKYYCEIIGSETSEIISQQYPEQTCFIRYFGCTVTSQTKSISLIMEHGGAQLHEYVNRSNKKPCFEERTLIQYFKKIIFSLYELRKRGVFNCDLKPGNLMINERKECKIIDFSICLIAERLDFENFEFKVRGTPGYSSPEINICLKKELGFKHLKFDVEKSDVYSLGLVFIEMCTNEKMSGKNRMESLDEISVEISKINYPWAKSLVQDMVKFDPSDRPTFEELYLRICEMESR